MALYFECQINKNVLLQAVFWRFCPLGRLSKLSRDRDSKLKIILMKNHIFLKDFGS